MDKIKRCPNGTRRNKKSGHCEKHKKKTKKKVKQSEIPVFDLEQFGRKRCPKGMKRIKGTMLCKPKENIKILKDTPTYKDSLEDLVLFYNKNKTNQVIPYDCFRSSNIMMFLHLIKRNKKTACLYDILHIGSLQSRKNRLYFSNDTRREQFTDNIKMQYKKP